MAIDVDAYRFGYRISGVEPKGDAVYLGSQRARRAFWEAVGRFAVRAKQDALARGLDRMGREMAPIAGLTRLARRVDVDPTTGERPYSPMGKADPDAPPLQATGARSRTRSLLTARVEGNGVWVYWRRDPATGRLWGEVLARHARGFLQRFVWPRPGVGWVKPRDVLGASNAERAEIERAAAEWWALNRRRYESDLTHGSEAKVRKSIVGAGSQPVDTGGRSYFGPGVADVTALAGEASRLPNRELFAFAVGRGRVRFGGAGGARPVPPPMPRPPAGGGLSVALRPAGVMRGMARPGDNREIPASIRRALPEYIDARTFGDLFRSPFGWWWWLVVGLALWVAWEASAEEEQ
jgi:hypothetical protein